MFQNPSFVRVENKKKSHNGNDKPLHMLGFVKPYDYACQLVKHLNVLLSELLAVPAKLACNNMIDLKSVATLREAL